MPIRYQEEIITYLPNEPCSLRKIRLVEKHLKRNGGYRVAVDHDHKITSFSDCRLDGAQSNSWRRRRHVGRMSAVRLPRVILSRPSTWTEYTQSFASLAAFGDPANSAMFNSTGAFEIGRNFATANLNGWLDEIRITKGFCRHGRHDRGSERGFSAELKPPSATRACSSITGATERTV